MLEDISMEDEVEESSVKATLLKGKTQTQKKRKENESWWKREGSRSQWRE